MQNETPVSKMQGHDPLCTAMHKNLILPSICSPCQLIKTVRIDERERAVNRLYAEAEDSGIMQLDLAVWAVRFG